LKTPTAASAPAIRLSQRAITTIRSDVIVNSANPWLGGIGPDLTLRCGGVDGAIHRAAGIGLYNECMSLPTFAGSYNGEAAEMRCNHGDLRVTNGYGLPCKKVFHAVAPRYIDGNSGELDLLATLYQKIFMTLVEMEFRTISIPPLGTRSFGMPRVRSAFIALHEAFLFVRKSPIKICFSLIDKEEYAIYQDFRRANLQCFR
jgi:O-acetyl-ADP-ribose deacetylase